MKSFHLFLRPVVVVGLLGAMGVLDSAITSAHHSFAAFEMERDVKYEGVVVDYKLMNPHTHFTLRVAAGAKDAATVGTWDVEGASFNIMTRQGWKKSTLKPGDKLVVVGRPMRDGSKGISLFYAEFPDGKRLYNDIARPKDSQ